MQDPVVENGTKMERTINAITKHFCKILLIDYMSFSKELMYSIKRI